MFIYRHVWVTSSRQVSLTNTYLIDESPHQRNEETFVPSSMLVYLYYAAQLHKWYYHVIMYGAVAIFPGPKTKRRHVEGLLKRWQQCNWVFFVVFRRPALPGTFSDPNFDSNSRQHTNTHTSRWTNPTDQPINRRTTRDCMNIAWIPLIVNSFKPYCRKRVCRYSSSFLNWDKHMIFSVWCVSRIALAHTRS